MAEGQERLAPGSLLRSAGPCVGLRLSGGARKRRPGKGTLNLELVLRGAVLALHGVWLVGLPCEVMLAFMF